MSINDLTLADLATDPPEDAIICPDCGGWGIKVVYPGFYQSSEDCETCEGNGWIIPCTRCEIRPRYTTPKGKTGKICAVCLYQALVVLGVFNSEDEAKNGINEASHAKIT